MAADIRWEEPPPGRRAGEGKYQDVFDALRANPGRWARWPGPVQSSTSSTLMRGGFTGSSPGEFEARSTIKDGVRTMWVRKPPPAKRPAGAPVPGMTDGPAVKLPDGWKR